jgi:hypothetical protein
MSNVAINIAAEYTGKAAFDKANKSVTGLERNVKKMAAGLGVGLGLSALTAFGKTAVKAFAADEVSARRLATAVDNLGLSFSQTRVTDFIANLEKSAGIADDVLRPAFQALLNTTGSLTKSQELLNNAIQISRASGVDLATVSQDLANGYVGITRGLKKYNTGLTQAELKSKSFADILGIMLVKSAGAAQDYLTTTAYKMDVLTLAGNNAKETIGSGLVDAFAKIGGGSTASDAAQTIGDIAKAINGITQATGFAIGGLVKLYRGLDYLTSFGGLTGANGSLAGMLESKPSTNRSKSPAGTAARTAQQRAAEAAAAKRAKELADLTKKQVSANKALTAEQKKQADLKKAGSVFDLEQIQIIAALKGNLSAEDRTRLEAQAAILNGNADLATKLTKEILMAQDSTGKLYQYFLSIGNAKIANPFAFLDQWILDFQMKLNALTAPSTATYRPAGLAPELAAIGVVAGYGDYAGSIANQASNVDFPSYGMQTSGNTVINVQVQGNVIREQELIDKVLAGAQLSSLSGSPSQIGRIAGMFG